MIEPKPKCADCVQPCEEECLGHLTEDEQIALYKYLEVTHEQKYTPEEEIEND